MVALRYVQQVGAGRQGDVLAGSSVKLHDPLRSQVAHQGRNLVVLVREGIEYGLRVEVGCVKKGAVIGVLIGRAGQFQSGASDSQLRIGGRTKGSNGSTNPLFGGSKDFGLLLRLNQLVHHPAKWIFLVGVDRVAAFIREDQAGQQLTVIA